MAAERVTRRLAAILAADVVGYSRLMREDEEGTLAALNGHRAELIDSCIAEHQGRIVKTTGDGVLAEFASAVDAVRCAVEFQEGMHARNADVPAGRRIQFRIGVNLGDVIVQDDDVYGDGVNVAARLEGLAGPGEVWLSGDVVRQVRGKVRVAFEDLGPRDVKNIAEPVQAFRVEIAGDLSAGPEGARDAGPPLPDKPSIAVLPFDNMSGEPEQEYFADGITEDIITALSRFRWFFVIARHSSFTYKRQPVNVTRVARELGVQYLLEGSVRKAGNNVRVTAQLVDGQSGNHIWAETYDRELSDIFRVQDDIVRIVAGTIEPELSRAEQDRARRKTPESLDAWNLYQRGLWHLWRFEKEHNVEALRLFEKAIEIDPRSSPAFSALAVAHMESLYLGFAADPSAALRAALDYAQQAIVLDESNPFAYTARGSANLFRRDHEAALNDLNKAIEINPSFAPAYLRRGMTLSWMNRPREAIPDLETAARLSPKDPHLSLVLMTRALAHLIEREFDVAEHWGRRSIQAPNPNVFSYFVYAAALGHLGRLDEAQDVATNILRQKPDFSVTFVQGMLPTNIDEVRGVILDGLRKAGLPE